MTSGGTPKGEREESECYGPNSYGLSYRRRIAGATFYQKLAWLTGRIHLHVLKAISSNHVDNFVTRVPPLEN